MFCILFWRETAFGVPNLNLHRIALEHQLQVSDASRAASLGAGFDAWQQWSKDQPTPEWKRKWTATSFRIPPDDFCLAICDETIMKSLSIAEIQVVQTVQVKNLSLVIPGRMENV